VTAGHRSNAEGMVVGAECPAGDPLGTVAFHVAGLGWQSSTPLLVTCFCLSLVSMAVLATAAHADYIGDTRHFHRQF